MFEKAKRIKLLEKLSEQQQQTIKLYEYALTEINQLSESNLLGKTAESRMRRLNELSTIAVLNSKKRTNFTVQNKVNPL